MGSEKPTGADNQQGSRKRSSSGRFLTPQRLHAELLGTGAKGLEAYLQGALRDGTRSSRHNTHRIGQADRRWLETIGLTLDRLGHRWWIYREGRTRAFWILETSAPFLSVRFNAAPLIGTSEGLCYVRGYFDAEGGMPRDPSARLYLQLCQKDRANLETAREILESWAIRCGRVHNPSVRVDPDYWRFYVRAGSHQRFMTTVGSWHPRKRQLLDNRMKI
jgi:hypothetical protein